MRRSRAASGAPSGAAPGARQYQLQRFAPYLNGFPEFPRNVRVIGLRGVGKTVLLQRYAALAEESEWVVVRRKLGIDLQAEAAFGLAVLDDCRFALDRVSRRTAVEGRALEVSDQEGPDTINVASDEPFVRSLVRAGFASLPRERAGRGRKRA